MKNQAPAVVMADPDRTRELAGSIVDFITSTFPRKDGNLCSEDVFPAMVYALARFVSGTRECSADSVILDVRDALVKYGVFYLEN